MLFDIMSSKIVSREKRFVMLESELRDLTANDAPPARLAMLLSPSGQTEAPTVPFTCTPSQPKPWKDGECIKINKVWAKATTISSVVGSPSWEEESRS